MFLLVKMIFVLLLVSVNLVLDSVVIGLVIFDNIEI